VLVAIVHGGGFLFYLLLTREPVFVLEPSFIAFAFCVLIKGLDVFGTHIEIDRLLFTWNILECKKRLCGSAWATFLSQLHYSGAWIL